MTGGTDHWRLGGTGVRRGPLSQSPFRIPIINDYIKKEKVKKTERRHWISRERKK